MQDQYDLAGSLSAPVDIEKITIVELDLFIDEIQGKPLLEIDRPECLQMW